MNSEFFIYVGPSKTASTWIYKVLKENPCVDLPIAKDIYYFDQFYNKGKEWYENHFSKVDVSKVTGEFSHDYILSNEALKRIFKDYPSVKIITTVRNPFERTASGVGFLRRNGYGYEEISELIVKHSELKEGSLVSTNIKRLMSVFPREQILILNFDGLTKDPFEFYKTIERFLCLDSFEPEFLLSKANSFSLSRSKRLSYMVKRLALIARSLGAASLVSRLKMSPIILRLVYKKPNNGENSSQVLSLDDKVYLSAFFNPEIDELERITGWDVNDWKI